MGILGDFPIDTPQTKILEGMCPRHPGGVDASGVVSPEISS